MSVLGSQVDVDMEESVPDPVPKHQGHTGTGCYKLHDHEFMRPRGRPARKGGGAGPPPTTTAGPTTNQPANLMDLPVAELPAISTATAANNPTKALKQFISPAQRSAVSRIYFLHVLSCDVYWTGCAITLQTHLCFK